MKTSARGRTRSRMARALLQRRPPSWAWQGAVMMLAMALALAYTIRTGRDFWYDEAMLVQAIRLDGWLPPWQPLSNFEQADPWGVYLLQKALLSLVGFQPSLLRLPGFIAYVIGGLATWRAARLWFGGVPSLLAGIAAVAGVDVVQSAGDFKHYIVEFAVAGVALWLTGRVIHSPTRRRVGVLIGATLLAVPFSNTVAFVVPGALLAMAVAVPGLRRAALAGAALFVVVFGFWYLICIRPSTVFQLAYPTYRDASSVDGYTGLVQTVAQPGGGYFVSLVGVAAAGLAAAVIWQRRFVAAFLPALVAVVLGWVGVRLGAVPFSADRHLLFLVPLIALAVGASIRTAAATVRLASPSLPRPGPAMRAAVAITLALGAMVTIAPSAGLVRQQTGQAIAASTAACPSFYVDWWSQPMVVLYADALGIGDRVHGAVSTRSGRGPQAWLYRVINSPEQYQQGLVLWFQRHPSSCLVTVGGASEQEIVFQPLAAAGLVCAALPSPTGIFLNRCTKPGS